MEYVGPTYSNTWTNHFDVQHITYTNASLPVFTCFGKSNRSVHMCGGGK